MLLNVTKREFATILAGLRHWQRTSLCDNDSPEYDIATDGGTHEPLDADEIERLCKKMNCRPAKKGK